MALMERSYFGRIERGQSQPTLFVILKIANALGVDAGSRWGNLQDAADRLDPKLLAVLVDEILQDLMQRSSSAWAKNALDNFRISLALRSSRFSRSRSLMR